MEWNTADARTITTVRVVNAAREQVFGAWTDPAILAKWWGPAGFTNTFHAFELRPEGVWDFTMHGPDGTSHHNTSIFTHIEAPSLLEFDHIKPMHRFHVVVRFEDLSDRTRIVWYMIHPTAEECEKVRSFVPAANEQNLDRLEAALREPATG